MVMVTHDVNLKNFAHQVVRMRDGKIASVERVSPMQRRQQHDELAMALMTVCSVW